MMLLFFCFTFLNFLNFVYLTFGHFYFRFTRKLQMFGLNDCLRYLHASLQSCSCAICTITKRYLQGSFGHH